MAIKVYSDSPDTDPCPRCGQIWGTPPRAGAWRTQVAEDTRALLAEWTEDEGNAGWNLDDLAKAIAEHIPSPEPPRAALAAAQAGAPLDWDVHYEALHAARYEGLAEGRQRGFAAGIEAATQAARDAKAILATYDKIIKSISDLRPAETAGATATRMIGAAAEVLQDNILPKRTMEFCLNVAAQMLVVAERQMAVAVATEPAGANPCARILDFPWLDPECVANGCQSLLLQAKAGAFTPEPTGAPSEEDVIRAWWGDLELCDNAAASWHEHARRVMALLQRGGK